MLEKQNFVPFVFGNNAANPETRCEAVVLERTSAAQLHKLGKASPQRARDVLFTKMDERLVELLSVELQQFVCLRDFLLETEPFVFRASKFTEPKGLMNDRRSLNSLVVDGVIQHHRGLIIDEMKARKLYARVVTPWHPMPIYRFAHQTNKQAVCPRKSPRGHRARLPAQYVCVL